MSRTLLLLAAMACQTNPSHIEQDSWRGASAETWAAPAPLLTLEASTVVAGGTLDLTVTGANPSERVYFAASAAGLGAGP